MEKSIKLLIVAADPLVRTSLAILFDDVKDCQIIRAINPAVALMDILDEQQQPEPNLILWDLGWDVGEVGDLDFQELDLPVVTLIAQPEQSIEAWRAGARGILSRELDVDDMLVALKAVVNGLLVLDPAVTSTLLPSTPRLPGQLSNPPTARELEILQLLAEGLTNRAIATELSISEHTVKFHVNAILNKFDAQSRTEAVVTATKLGYIIL
ncbi:MAG: LuxR C-terminal-related transcriptional regulator [Candidatus Promineifilaceae bacterium]